MRYVSALSMSLIVRRPCSSSIRPTFALLLLFPLIYFKKPFLLSPMLLGSFNSNAACAEPGAACLGLVSDSCRCAPRAPRLAPASPPGLDTTVWAAHGPKAPAAVPWDHQEQHEGRKRKQKCMPQPPSSPGMHRVLKWPR